jgi:hypothetical protein
METAVDTASAFRLTARRHAYRRDRQRVTRTTCSSSFDPMVDLWCPGATFSVRRIESGTDELEVVAAEEDSPGRLPGSVAIVTPAFAIGLDLFEASQCNSSRCPNSIRGRSSSPISGWRMWADEINERRSRQGDAFRDLQRRALGRPGRKGESNPKSAGFLLNWVVA